MVSNEYSQNLYKWDRIGELEDTFYCTYQIYGLLRESAGKPKKQRKIMRKKFFAIGYNIKELEVRIWLHYDLDIKRHKLHDKISAKVKTSELTRKQRKKYRKELFRSIIYMKVLRSQLKFKPLADYFTPNYDFHNEQIERLINTEHGTT